MKVRPDSEGLAADHVSIDAVVERANQLPGFDGWSSEIQEIKTDFADVDPSTKEISLGVSAIVRVTLTGGTSHDAIGYGYVTACKNRGGAFQKAKEKAVADGLRGAIQLFGASTKQHTSEPGSSKDSCGVSERLCSNASLETEDDEVKTHGSSVLQADSAESEFGSDPFETIELGNKPKT